MSYTTQKYFVNPNQFYLENSFNLLSCSVKAGFTKYLEETSLNYQVKIDLYTVNAILIYVYLN